MDIQNLLDMAMEFVLTYGLNLIGAIVIFVIGRWAAGMASRMMKKILTATKTNVSLVHFAGSLVYYGIIIFAAVAALEKLGVETTSFVALLAAGGLAIGMALSGALANLAAGVLILLFQPFKVGDLIEVAGAFGAVEEIQIFSTIILTPDNKTVIIPNGQITSGNIVNYSEKNLLRLDLVFGIGYDDDLLKAKGILEELVAADDRVAKDPAPTVAVLELGDSSVNFAVRPYVRVVDYWDVHFSLTEAVKLRFDQEGISIPYPQQDVHLMKMEPALPG